VGEKQKDEGKRKASPVYIQSIQQDMKSTVETEGRMVFPVKGCNQETVRHELSLLAAQIVLAYSSEGKMYLLSTPFSSPVGDMRSFWIGYRTIRKCWAICST
jgi:hypothetical protein